MTNSTSTSISFPSRLWYLPFIILLLALGLLTWGNFLFSESNPGGTDFLVHWVGARSFIFKGQSPYSEETADEIQNMVYGREAQGGEHELRVVYPFYSTILFAPFSLVENYTLARALWMTVLEIAIIIIGIFSIRLAGWRVSLWFVPLYVIFSLFWYHGMRALINGNAVVIVTLFLIGALVAIQKDQDVLAGLLLALGTIKPHLVVMLILFVLVWAFSHRRWTLVGWIFGWVFFLCLLGVIFLPDWLMQNIWEIMKFPGYNPALSIGEAFQEWWPGIGTQLKWGLTIFLVALVIFEWSRTVGKGYNQFLWTACLTLAVSQWIGIATDPGNFILLFFPMVLIFSVIKERWNRYGNWIVLGIMILLLVGLWWLFLNTVIYGDQPLQHPVMFVPMPLFVLVGLYWVRWWVIRPTRGISITALLTFR
jgi:hypothetical protein